MSTRAPPVPNQQTYHIITRDPEEHMRAIHFVYAGDPNGNSINSPFTITQNLFQELKSTGLHVHYYDWCHTGPLHPVGPDDIIIGHPNYPPNTATRRLFRSSATPHKFLIFPIHHGIPSINLPFSDLVARARHVFGIMGPYWYDTLEHSQLAAWKDKITRLDMAIDSTSYPYCKQKWNQRGHRVFTYIGCDRPEKGLKHLYEIFSRVPHTLHVYGNVDGANPLHKLPNVKLNGYTITSAKFGQDLCNMTDAFINTSISDANPTTLLEAGCWGLVVVCSPQSGYYGTTNPFLSLDIGNIQSCINQINYIQNADEHLLRSQSISQRTYIEVNLNWGYFRETIKHKLVELGAL